MEPEENLLPRFYELLSNAFHASEEVDMYDLDSTNPESKAVWDILIKNSAEAQSELIGYIRENLALLPQIMSLTQ